MRRMIILLGLLISGSVLAGEVVDEKHLKLNADGINKFVIDCGAGFLRVTGDAGLDQIEVVAEIEADRVRDRDKEEFVERNVRLTLEQRGSKAVLRSEVRDGWTSSHNIRINLVVRVPHGIDLEIDDGSGSTEIQGIHGDVVIDDGSGSMDISDIKGNVDVDDGSGSLDIWNIDGDVDLDDGSGSVSLKDINGNIKISDGSGSITIDDVEKDVYIKESGSGGLSINNVKGTVTKRDD